MSTENRWDKIGKEKKEIFSKQIVTKNKCFSVDQITMFFELFNLYADQRRQCNVLDIITTAKTLTFDKKYPIIYEAMVGIGNQLDGKWVGFEQFLKRLTQTMGNPETLEGRRSMFQLVDLEGKEKLTIGDLMRISDNLNYNFQKSEVQKIIKKIAGPNAREITWNQFQDEIARKMEKKVY